MNEWLKRVRAQAEEFWKSLSPSRRTMLIAGVAALVGTLVLIGSLSSRPNFVPLFTRLEPQDAGLIVAKLKEAGIPYKLEANGTAILVPEENVYETRLTMASQGLPRGGVFGFELFNETQLGTTDFERRLKYNWALQGELTRTIRNLSEVEDARVHIVLPERSLFVQEEKEPTASVLLKLKPYAQLTEEQIRGIAHLLAGSVEGLKPENVTILDSSGNILSEFLADEVKDRQPGSFSDRKLAAQIQVRRDLERELSRSVQTMLERVFGPGRVVARVSADLNFDYEESNAELFTPVTGENGILRSQQEQTEHYEGSGFPFPGGVPGVTSNVPGYQALEDRGQATYEKRNLISNYEINRTQQHRIAAPGRINRLTVAVWIDGQLTPQQIASVRNAVASTVGFNEARGDQISVESMQFERAEVTAFQEKRPLPAWLPWAVAAAVAAVGAGVGGFLWMRQRRLEELRKKAAEEAQKAVLPPLMEQPEEAKRALTPEEQEKQRVERQVVRLANERTEEFAQLLKTWLMEEER